MGYKYSQDDKSNLTWFKHDNSRQSLKRLLLSQGKIRGIDSLDIEFTYPISAFAGKNGSGKSTVLALAACAFHNAPDGFRLPDRSLPYYRFSDFFFQTTDEVPLEGIDIRYGIAHNDWTKSPQVPEGVGLAYQARKKQKGGKWNDYDTRVDRNVVFFGIDRVVPPSEKSVFRSSRYKFSELGKDASYAKVCSAVGKIIGFPYNNLKIKAHGKYRLPVVNSSGMTYSGFNMGAGEKAMFEIFAAIHRAPDGTLFIIDEIELGLHEGAQQRFVQLLKETARERKIQVIATTHSGSILNALPPEGRFYIEKRAGKTTVFKGITPDFATGKMAGRGSGEIRLFVEDRFAKRLLTAALSLELRARTEFSQLEMWTLSRSNVHLHTEFPAKVRPWRYSMEIRRLC